MKLKLKILSLALLLSLFITNTFNIFSVSAEEIPHLNLNELVQLGLEPLDLCDQRLVENDSFLNFTKNTTCGTNAVYPSRMPFVFSRFCEIKLPYNLRQWHHHRRHCLCCHCQLRQLLHRPYPDYPVHRLPADTA